MPPTENLDKINEALKYLSKIPQMKNVLNNLPENIRYEFSEKTPGVASFECDENKIIINPQKMNFQSPQDRLSFYITLAHELCHANQKKEGLYFNDLSSASFGDTFRVAKMMEIETRLQDAIIENELLKRDEFKTCPPSLDCEYYRSKLDQAGNNLSKANSDFILSYWQNSKNDLSANPIFKNNINNKYFFYMEQAYHQALLMHNPRFKCPSTMRSSPLDVIKSYLSRMNAKNLDPPLFLQNKFDNASLTDHIADGVTILHYNGDKYLNIKPTMNPLLDKVTYFKNGQVSESFLKNGITNEIHPITETNTRSGGCSSRLYAISDDRRKRYSPDNREKIRDLSALEIAIESGNIDRIKGIISKDPSIINRQMPVGRNFPILMAIQNNNKEAAEYILSKNPNLLLQTESRKSVLTELPCLKDTALQKKIRSAYLTQKKSFEAGKLHHQFKI